MHHLIYIRLKKVVYLCSVKNEKQPSQASRQDPDWISKHHADEKIQHNIQPLKK